MLFFLFIVYLSTSMMYLLNRGEVQLLMCLLLRHWPLTTVLVVTRYLEKSQLCWHWPTPADKTSMWRTVVTFQGLGNYLGRLCCTFVVYFGRGGGGGGGHSAYLFTSFRNSFQVRVLDNLSFLFNQMTRIPRSQQVSPKKTVNGATVGKSLKRDP